MTAKYLLTYVLCFIVLTACSAQAEPDEPHNNIPELDYEITQNTTITKLAGSPFEVSVDNCANPSATKKNEQRSKSFQSELSIEVSNKLALEFGGDVKLAKIALQDEIGMTFGIKFGQETLATSSLETEILPNHRAIITAQWKETWMDGTAVVKQPDGSLVDQMPFTALNSLALEQISAVQTPCEEQLKFSLQPTLAAAIAIPTPTLVERQPTRLDVLAIPGNSVTGITYRINQSGNYVFRYLEGSYRKYALDKNLVGEATWSTAARIFKNRPVEWDGKMVSETADYRMFIESLFDSKLEAESATAGNELSLWLVEGDELTFVAVDHKDYYYDNPGEIVVEVIY